jgi:hypothetical protein
VHTEVSVARQPSHRSDADEPGETGEFAGTTDSAEAERASEGDDRSLWEDVLVDPVEIALPGGSGFTLRAYRLSTELTPTDISDRDEEDPFARSRATAAEIDDETVVILEEGFTDEDLDAVEKASRRGRRRRDEDVDDEDPDDEFADEEEDEEDEEEEEEPAAEEVPVFLSHRGRVLLFKSPESLVSFVRSGAPNDLAQLDTYNELVERIQPGDVAPLDEDSYELDLVVENLRGGHDVWDSTLLIKAGEVARDLAYALRLPAVLDMLSPGSSLDDLDEALRSTASGGLGAFRGRRRLKKIGAQTASLGWRTIIGKISAAVDWRD